MLTSSHCNPTSLFRLFGRVSAGVVMEIAGWGINRAEERTLIYSVRHTTTFRYEPAVRESVMEVRLQPRSDGEQRCLSFMLNVDPAANVMQYRDFTGNTVHHFDIAGTHKLVKVTAQSAVEGRFGP